MELNLLDIPDKEVRHWTMQRAGIPSQKNMSVPPPSIMQIELTRNCNNACIMCHKGQMPEGKDFDRRDISDESLDLTRPVFPHLKKAMLFGDGEPMLYKGFWNLVRDIRYASPNCIIDFINNGSLMNNVSIAHCLEYEVSHMGLSIGGATAKTHNYIRKLSDFDRVINNFRALNVAKQSVGKLEPYISVLIVVMQSNYQEIPDVIALASDLDFLDVECQKLHVTHESMRQEEVSDSAVEPIFAEASNLARKLRIGFKHYPIEGRDFSVPMFQDKINPLDDYFKGLDPIHNSGYCRHGQPWNTVYVLCDGRVFPDCHWWKSKHLTDMNICGNLSGDNDILRIWNDKVYGTIRDLIQHGEVLPQCRGCGLSGGVKPEFRSSRTDHTNPYAE